MHESILSLNNRMRSLLLGFGPTFLDTSSLKNILPIVRYAIKSVSRGALRSIH